MNYWLLLQTKQNGAWKNASKIYIKKNDAWKEAKDIYIKKSGTWYPIKKIPILPSNPYTDLTECIFDTWGIDLDNRNGNGWNMNTNWLAFYSSFYSQCELVAKIRSEENQLKKTVQYLVGLPGNEINFNEEDTKAAYFFAPPLAGWSDKNCYIKNNGSWYELTNAQSVDSGWYRLTFNGSSFSCSK